MKVNNNPLMGKVALITGAAKRLGAEIATTLHARGMKVVIHYNQSSQAAQKLQVTLEKDRENSVFLLKGDLSQSSQLSEMLNQVVQKTGQLDVLVNNASVFYPTPIMNADESNWDELIGVNLKSGFFLSQAAAPFLQATKGCIVNLADLYAKQPLKSHSIYSISKAGVVAMTKTFAQELAPDVRVNAVAPGAILWPESGDKRTEQILEQTALAKAGKPSDIAKAVVYFVESAPFVTGQILYVDGGRDLGASDN